MTMQAVTSSLRWLPNVRASKDSQAVYLTFDDGPDPEGTPVLLDALRESRVRATFFMLGEAMDRYPDLVERVKADGHAIGLHGYAHLHNRQVPISAAWRDLRRMSDVARRHNVKLTWYRPPYGELTISALLWSWFTRTQIVMWNRDSRDFDAVSADVLSADLMRETPHSGDIVLFHDDSATSALALRRVLPVWKKHGVVFRTLNEEN
jgi:peptidoglycan/xylan/chitin deacetylase (PgdA/CDA1 family)